MDNKKYVVTQFGVDEKFNEYDTPIWEGEAESCEDAIDKAVNKRWASGTPEHREFMKGYLKAHLLGSN